MSRPPAATAPPRNAALPSATIHLLDPFHPGPLSSNTHHPSPDALPLPPRPSTNPTAHHSSGAENQSINRTFAAAFKYKAGDAPAHTASTASPTTTSAASSAQSSKKPTASLARTGQWGASASLGNSLGSTLSTRLDARLCEVRNCWCPAGPSKCGPQRLPVSRCVASSLCVASPLPLCVLLPWSRTHLTHTFTSTTSLPNLHPQPTPLSPPLSPPLLRPS